MTQILILVSSNRLGHFTEQERHTGGNCNNGAKLAFSWC